MPTEVMMPRLGESSAESMLLEWLVNEGEQIEQGQPLFEAESDKAALVVEASVSGVVGKLLASPGEVISAGRVIAVLLAPDEKLPEQYAVRKSEQVLSVEAAPTAAELQIFERPPRVKATPRARRLARSEGIDLSTLVGTGEGGRLLEADVKDAIEKRGDSRPPVSAPARVAVPASLTGLRGTIARRMSQSAQSTARVTLMMEVDATALVDLRQRLNQDASEEADSISYDLLLVVIAAKALGDYPYMNASLTDDGIVQHEHINVGVAVHTDRGLLVPVLKAVPSRSLPDLARELNELVARAREGSATADDLTGGTFTVTNLGVLGIDAFTPIINLPECAILGVGRIVNKPVVRNGDIVVGQTLVLSLTFDHRVIDGAPAARFLQRIAQLIGAPGLLLLR